MRCIELFAGAGGAALGLEAAGIEHAALCEWDAHACATLRAAGLGPVVEGDVRDLDAIEAVAGPSCDLLWSSFPCQAFSTAGKRLGASDDRNGWPWTVDALDRFRPRWFLAENVRGLITHSTEGHPDPYQCPACYFHGVILPQLRARFEYVGWWLLDAADYGVPQHRRRVIIWAGPAPVKAPRPTHGDSGAARQGALFGPGVLPWVSMAEALGVSVDDCRSTGGFQQGRPVYVVRGPSSAVTISVSSSKPQDSAGVPFIMENGNPRRLTVQEAARLQDFPAGHPWQGPEGKHYSQIGNAVPPKLAEVVGRAVMQAEATR
jgi:DNA (cytosine-5)-methyltransferase 1